MKKILLPTDFSDNSWNAIAYALKLYKNQKCNFVLLNTYTPIIYNVDYMEINGVTTGVIDSMKEASENSLNDLLNKIQKEFKNPNHSFSMLSSFNTLVSEIKDLHKENKIDFIVMGTKGATGLAEILFGSNTIHIIKNVKCPILAVPSGFDFESPEEILFPSDYELSFKQKHLQPVLEIAETYTSRVHFLNVSFDNNLTDKQTNNKKTLERSFKKIAHVFHSVSNQNVTDAIARFGLKVDINLLVMINNKHSFFENLFFQSKIHQIGFHLNIPFLIIPSKI